MYLSPSIRTKPIFAFLRLSVIGVFLLASWASSSAEALLPNGIGIPSNRQLPEGFERITVETAQGKVSVTLPRRRYSFQPQGRTYFVDRAGSDLGSGTKDRPFATIDKGLSELQPGDLLYIRGGDYETPFSMTRSGLPGRPIILSSYPGETVRILQPVGWQQANLHSATVTLKSVRYVWLHGLDIQGCRGRADAPPPDTYGQNALTLANKAGEGVKILNCTLSKALHCGLKEMGHGGSKILIEGNLIFDNGINVNQDHGIYMPANDVVIRGNAIFRNAGYGIHLYMKPKRVQVYNNVVFEHPRDGIMQAGSGGLIAHNVAVRNRYGLKLFRDGCVGNTFVNNIFMNNRDGQIGMDNAGGKRPWPSQNTFQGNIVFPVNKRAVSSDNEPPANERNVIMNPKLENEKSNDLRLNGAITGTYKAAAVRLNGMLNWPNPGIFPATRYTDPVW